MHSSVWLANPWEKAYNSEWREKRKKEQVKSYVLGHRSN